MVARGNLLGPLVFSTPCGINEVNVRTEYSVVEANVVTNALWHPWGKHLRLNWHVGQGKVCSQRLAASVRLLPIFLDRWVKSGMFPTPNGIKEENTPLCGRRRL
jgi:hypothetical protein